MTDRFVDEARANMGAIERLLKGLPGIRGYVDKELRRDADKRLRELIAGQLEEQKQALLTLQNSLLKSGGLQWLDDVDGAIRKLQILIDRVKTASMGYAGLFDAVRIQEQQLEALHRFDVALAEKVVAVQKGVRALQDAVASNESIGAVAAQLTGLIDQLNTLFNRRREAILSPDLLTDPGQLPEVDETWLGEPSTGDASSGEGEEHGEEH
ncbi:hypothetical protein FKZ61_009075 [Litorilinea aerophila]|uniref:Uncharacterized protein n=1 Tax=Litorilinea aerophila TaxID=1204385 RepID=A0A540VHG7_9CHLR|nr:hypothetical protein [Litorilinea aerophila]MCC9076261.1 hypothetical protein [Litorilinea aerophila]OUC09741.1 hypothetical protein RY27_01005 [Litorilinea aerophila]GIV80002.1 MAG: hypothetical protein KatS3mg050_4396 [Litorilinea sp.]